MPLSDHQALAAAARDLAAELEVEQLPAMIVEHARRLFDADATLYVPDASQLVPRASTTALSQEAPIASVQGLVGRCAQLRHGAIDDRPAPAGSGGRAMAHALTTTEAVLGVIALRRAPGGPPFAAADLLMLESFGIHATIALQNARLHGEAQQRIRATTTLLAVAQALSRPGPVGDAMRRVAREIVRSLGAEGVAAYALDARQDVLRPLAAHGMPKPVIEVLRRMPLRLDRASGIREAIHGQTVLFSSDAGNDPRLDGGALAPLPPHSVLFAPTVAHGETIGGLMLVWWRVGRELHPAEIRLVQGMAAQVGLALENVELARQTERKLQETETLLSISRALSSTLDLQPLLRHFLRRIAGVLDADTVGSYMLQEDGEWLTPLQGYRLPPDRLDALRRMRMSIVQHPFYAEAARTKRPMFSSDVANDPRIPDVVRDAAQHSSQLFVPIVARDRVIGGLLAGWWDRVRDFSDSEMALIEAIASQAGIAIENARLFAENRRRVKELSVLHELSRAVTGELDRAALISALQSQVARVFDVPNIVVVLRDEAGDDLVVPLWTANSAVSTGPPLRYPREGVGLLSVILKTGQPLRTDDYVAECARHGVEPMASVASFPYWLGAPMTAGDQILGILILSGKERPFAAADERLLGNIAQLAALALRSAGLFEDRTRAYGELAAAQDQLVRTEKLRALGEMASGVAHDFNNLLAAILGRAQLLLTQVQDARLRRWIQVIEQSARDGAHTVRRLQEFTRIRRDEPHVAVDLNDIVRDALQITRTRWRDEAASRGVEVDVRTSLEPLPPIAGDPPELREVMTNLILNAVDAMPDGGILAVTTAVAGDAIELTVSDTGTGMSETIRARIFDPFFTTKGPQGTGLGLSMTYGIVTRHGARITVESEQGRGTTFRLTFPRRDPTVAEEVAAAAPKASVSLRALVVDDEKEIAALVGDVLEGAGHKAVILNDGAEAIARAAAEPFDVVFTDLAMPGVSGWQVARAVKARTPDVPVIVITGFGVELSPEQRRTQGVDAVLVKPLELNTILHVVAGIAAQKTA